MRKYVDYIEEHKLEEARIEARCEQLISEKSPEKMMLLEKIIKTDLNQFRYIKDEAKRGRIENRYYPTLCELAQVHGGRVELDINESYYYAILNYSGFELILDTSYPIEVNRFMEIIKDSDTITFEAEENVFNIRFSFEMNYKEKIEDHSHELKQFREEYKKL